MNLQSFFDISQASTKDEFKARLISFANEMDFGIVGAEVVVEREGQEPDYLYVGNRPATFAAAADPSIAKIDPVMQLLRRHGLPLSYDQKLYVDAGAPELWEIAAPFGYRTGIAVALRLGNNQQFILGLDREKPLSSDTTEITRMMADLQLLAMHCQDAALRFLGRAEQPSIAPTLTKRELQVLAWAKDGLTASQIGEKLFLSEATIKFHLRNIAAKLEAPSRTVSVLKAIKLGLLPP
jgi:DNA-binding CsgD family transcriptional regulator